ncbi:hypothetical protein [Fodinibius saliphilus]|uniref:hypothetical protein n=1 Tax=Fodinibius saliphilus TaxID=1920650 RepID=UPI00110A00D1|nr:hypothetical protein [Fodinibius saliphilus]
MKKLLGLIFLVPFLTGCFSSPYTNPGMSTNAGNPYRPSVEEPEKMEPCNYNSLDGEEIILSKNPKSTTGYSQYSASQKEMANSMISNGFPLVKVKPSLTAGNLSFKKYSEMEGKIIEKVEAEYNSAAEKQGVLSNVQFTNYYYKIVLSDCSIAYTNTGVGQMQYTSKETYDEAKKLVGDSVWVDKRADFGIYSGSDLTHLENVKIVGIEPVSFNRENEYMQSETVSSVILMVKNFKNETTTLPYNKEFFFSENPINQSWPSEIKYAIKNQEIVIGMSEKQARLSWGQPDDINSTVTAENRDEQWVYGDGTERTYLYFENGELTTYQN